MMPEWTFKHPEMLWALVLLPLLAAWWVWRNYRMQPVMRVSQMQPHLKSGFYGALRYLLFALRLMAFALLIVAMARPQTTDETVRKKTTEGIDIILAVDVSASMLARDLRPNRLEALKEVASNFVDNRPGDRIGLVLFGGESFGKVPLTTDHKLLKKSIQQIKYGSVADGTAIGMGLGTSVNRIKDSDAKSKVIILLTDGVNNLGIVDPITAAELAVKHDIKVYTIGLGSHGFAEMPMARKLDGTLVYQKVEVEIDEELLKKIADRTGGIYYRATDNKSLKEVYEEIDSLETSEIEELRFYSFDEKFYPLAWGALVLLALDFLLRITLMRSYF